MRGVDLTPTDEVVALLLLAAHQRNMRRRHIKRKLVGKSCCTSHRDLHLPHPKHSPDIQQKQQWQQQRQQQPTQMKHNHSGYLEAVGAQQDEQDGQQQCCNSSHELQQHSSTSQQSTSVSQTPGFGSSESSCSTDPASLAVGDERCAVCHCQSAACQQQECGDKGQKQRAEQQEACSKHSQDINDSAHSQVHQQGTSHQQATAIIRDQHGSQHQSSRAGKQKQMHVPKGVDVEQGWGTGNDAEGSDVDYDADDHQVSVFSEESRGCGFPCVITPSSMAAELAPDLTHQEAANLYLGGSAIVMYSVMQLP